MKKPAQILGHDGDDPIFAAYRRDKSRPGERTQHPGVLLFRCPACGNVHVHGAVGPDFGAGDGQRVAHCPREVEGRFSSYLLREVLAPSLAGDLRGF